MTAPLALIDIDDSTPASDQLPRPALSGPNTQRTSKRGRERTYDLRSAAL